MIKNAQRRYSSWSNQTIGSSGGALLRLALPLVLLAAFFGAPLVEAVWNSIDGLKLDLSRYATIFTDPIYLDVLVRTFRVSAVTTLFCIVLGYPMAFLLTTLSRRSRALLVVAIIVPLFTAFLIRTYGWMIILGRAGVLNKLLMAMGIIDTPLRILGTSTAVYIGLIHVLLPLAIFTMYASMAQIDRSLTIAAQVLGANPVRAFTRVYLPMTMPGVISAAMLVFIISIGFYITPVLLGGPADTMIAQLIVTQVTTLLDFPAGYALSIVLVIATIAVIALSNLFVPIEQMWALQESRTGTKRATKVRTLLRPLSYMLSRFENGAYLLLGRPDWLIPLCIKIFAAGIVLFLLAPIAIVYFISFSSSPYLIFPPPGYSLQLYAAFLGDAAWRDALFMSLQLAGLAATLAVALGALASFALVRTPFPGKRAVFLFLVSPLLVPVVVTALLFFVSMSDTGLLGTYPGLVLGHVILAIPYAIIVLVGAVRGLDRNIEFASATLGANAYTTFRKVVLPILTPALGVAWLLAFLHSFDELLVTLFLLGRLPQTLPIKIWSDIRIQIDPVISAASSTIVTAIIIVVVLSQIRGFFPIRRSAALSTAAGEAA